MTPDKVDVPPKKVPEVEESPAVEVDLKEKVSGLEQTDPVDIEDK